MTKTTDRYVERYAKQAEHDGIQMRLIGHWIDLAAYYEGSDGNAWSFQGRWVSQGPVDAFKARMSAGRIRGVLHGEGGAL